VSSASHRVVYTNEPFRAEVRHSDDLTGVPYDLVDGRMRAIMIVDGEEVELFDVVPTQAVDGWVTGFVSQTVIALCPVGVGKWDMVLEFENQDRMRSVGGTLQVREGIAQW
jgi:hypothetical protein